LDEMSCAGPRSVLIGPSALKMRGAAMIVDSPSVRIAKPSRGHDITPQDACPQ
jgi:hypothetical protein